MIRTFIETSDKLRDEEIRYLKASEQQQQKREESKNVLKAYSLVQKIGGKTDDYENLQRIIDEGREQNKQLENMVVQSSYHQASEMKSASTQKIHNFHALVNAIASRYG